MSLPPLTFSPTLTDAGVASSEALSKAGLGDDNRVFNIAAPGSSYIPPVFMYGALALALIWLVRR